MTRAPQQIALTELDRRFASLRLVTPEVLRRLRVSIEREGIRHPLLVSSAVEAGRWVLLDGFKRARVAEELGFSSVWVQLEGFDAAQAKAAIVHCNQARPGLSAVEEGWIVRALCREHGLSQPAVGRMLGRDKSWVCRRLKLVEALDSALQDDLRLGLLSSTVAREFARLPRGNQRRAADAARDHQLTSRQSARLVQRLNETADPAAREALLADPLRYLATETPRRGAASDPRLSEGGNRLRRLLLSFEGVSSHLTHSLSRHAPAGLGAEEAQVLAERVHQAIGAGRQATERLEALEIDSGVQARGAAEHA